MLRLWQTNPFESVVLVRGEGCRVWDSRGRSYLDLLAGCWCAVLGHSHPRLIAAVRDGVATLAHVGPPFASEGLEDGLSKLGEIVPAALDRVVLLNTGSEAVELALKMARAATGADRLVVVARSYYGATSYAYRLSEAGRNVPWLPAMGDIVRLPAPDCRNCPAGRTWPCENFPCLAALAEMGHRPEPPVAAVMFEPVLANAGVLPPPPGYGARLRALARDAGAIFISEEVTTGLGRTGRWFGYDHESIVPDVVVLGKALGGGLPVAAVVTTAEVETRCGGHLTHVQSHQNDPLSGRVAAAVVTTIQEEGLVERAAEMGAYFLAGLKELQARHSLIADVRGRGLMLGIELQRERSDAGPAVAHELLETGFIVNYQPQNAAFRLFPPYIIAAGEIDAFLGAFHSAIAHASG